MSMARITPCEAAVAAECLSHGMARARPVWPAVGGMQANDDEHNRLSAVPWRVIATGACCMTITPIVCRATYIEIISPRKIAYFMWLEML